jgi:hypothetical protein
VTTLIAVRLPLTDASRPWLDDMPTVQSPAQGPESLLDLLLQSDIDPAHHGELPQLGHILPWTPA